MKTVNTISKNLTNRIIWLDVLRAFACICVLLVHSPVKYSGQGGQYILAPANYLFMAWGVSVFFMISGALLFSKRQDLVPFYKKRFTRILLPTLIWSIIYLIFEACYYNDLSILKTNLWLIPFFQQAGLLWFVYALIGIYLITPIISAWLCMTTKRDVEIILGIWGLTLLVPYLKVLDPAISKIIEVNGILNYFYGFVGYALLGYYIKEYVDIKIKSFTFVALVFTALLIPIFIYASNIFPKEILNTSQNVSSALMSVVAFVFFKDINYRNTKFLQFIFLFAEFSFGIYLCHMLIVTPLNDLLAPLKLNYIIQIPITFSITIILSFLFVRILSHIPHSKFLLG